MQTRIIIHIDFDYFYAQIEEIRNPTLKSKPVVVSVYSGRTPNSGVVSTANYIARKHGVKSGMPIATAKKKLADADAAFLPVDHNYYEQVSNTIMKILKDFADKFEQTGIDEAYVDVTEKTDGNYEAAQKLAQDMKKEVYDKEKLMFSVGIGPNKLIAKIAANMQKPNGLTTIKPEEIEKTLHPMPVEKLPGVGTKTKEKLNALNINTIGELARTNVQKLITVFGQSAGTYLHNASQGIDETPVKAKNAIESISRIATLKENTRDLNLILQRANELCEEVYAALINQGFKYRTVGIAAVLINLNLRSKSKTLENPTNDLSIFKDTVKELFQKLLAESDREIRRVGVRLSGFVKEEANQRQITSFMESKEN
jgi:DNA polymerase IV (DinB-like DNA polymerase)